MTIQTAIEADLDLPEPPFDPSLVSEVLRMFGKAARAHQLYLPNNPMHARAIDAAKSGFASIWNPICDG
jgi:hypothetical protein